MKPEQFDNSSQIQGKTYELIGIDGTQHAHFRFSGNFAQKTVIWDAHLYTLAYYFNQVVKSSQPQSARQFIEVGELTESGRRIQIALNVPVIDESTIVKTIIMVRQYKRLASGRYEYGETIKVSKTNV